MAWIEGEDLGLNESQKYVQDAGGMSSMMGDMIQPRMWMRRRMKEQLLETQNHQTQTGS